MTTNKLEDWINNTIARIVRGWKIWRMKKKFKRACKLADDKHACDNKTYYVIQGDGLYKVWNSDEILTMKRRGVIKKNVHCLDVFEKASYVASSNVNLKLVSMKTARVNEAKRLEKEV
jgi:hypothetical protein